MQFDSFSALMAMDGHGIFVWPAYAIGVVVLLALVIHPLLKQRRFFRDYAMRLKREQRAAQRSGEHSQT
ncbi:MAG: heme exporter protein D [Paraglaciecola psychrophila]|jgi:heme exporter protein D